MVGCSARNCTNRSDKGFKTYRIPRDPSRRQEWIRFIGREGWIPGSGASICEAHFEASAYELHRADGLRKLKQNAVPTICVPNPIIRSKRKQIVQPRLEFSFNEESDDSFMHNAETGSAAKCNDNERKVSESTKSVKLKNMSEVLPVAKVKRGRHLKRRGRTKMVMRQSEGSVISSCVVTTESEHDKEEAMPCLMTSTVDPEEAVVRCFVCNKLITLGLGIRLDVPSEASRTLLCQCLDAFLSFEGSVGSQEVVCRRCCSLLNYIDRTEVELALLKGAISTCTKGKSKEQDSQTKSKLMKSEKILERFSRSLGERNYMMDLEELFIEKAGAENNLVERGPSQPDAKVGESCSRDSPSEEQEMFADVVLNSESLKNGEDLGHVTDQVRNKEELAVRDCIGVASIESQSLSELVETCKTSGSLTDDGVKSATCSGLTKEIENHSTVESLERTGDMGEDLKLYLGGQQKTHECKICCFKTVYESVMIWHLRLHMRTRKWCDFCSVAIPEQEAVLEVPKKTKCLNKPSAVKSSSKHPFMLPAIPVESMTVPLTSLAEPLLPPNNASSESPVVLVETQDLRKELVPESVVRIAEEENAKMEESRNSVAVNTSDSTEIFREEDLEMEESPWVRERCCSENSEFFRYPCGVNDFYSFDSSLDNLMNCAGAYGLHRCFL